MGLFISASGIIEALRRQDITAHNVANMGTAGFQASRARSTVGPAGGVGPAPSARDTSLGPMKFTGRPLDVAASDGFFRVRRPDGSIAFTRGGHFGLNANGEVVTANGARLDPPIQAPPNATSIVVLRDGTVRATMPGDLEPQIIGRIEVVQFTNPEGLAALGDNLFQQTPASGEPNPITSTAEFFPGTVQGSNVNVAAEQIDSILNVRALQANLNAFRAQDEVLGELLDLLS